MDGLGRCVLPSIDDMKESTLNKVFAYVGDTFVLIPDAIHKIVSERD